MENPLDSVPVGTSFRYGRKESAQRQGFHPAMRQWEGAAWGELLRLACFRAQDRIDPGAFGRPRIPSPHSVFPAGHHISLSRSRGRGSNFLQVREGVLRLANLWPCTVLPTAGIHANTTSGSVSINLRWTLGSPTSG